MSQDLQHLINSLTPIVGQVHTLPGADFLPASAYWERIRQPYFSSTGEKLTSRGEKLPSTADKLVKQLPELRRGH